MLPLLVQIIRTSATGSEIWTYGPTTLERGSRRTARGRRFSARRRRSHVDRAIAILGVFCITDDGQEAIEEIEVPQILLQARPASRHPGYRTGAQERLVGKQQLDKWCKMLEEHDLEVERGQEKPESVLYVRQLVWLGAMVSFDSRLWSRMSHLYCRRG